MKVNISNLSQGTHDYELSKDAAELGLAENFSGDVAARVAIEKSSRQIFLRANISVSATFSCDRCLSEFNHDVSTLLQTLYVWNTDDRPGSEDENVRVLTHDQNMIDISEDVRDLVVLAVPLKLLCREDCAGLCQRCGKNLNAMVGSRCDCTPREVDERWNKLAALADASSTRKRI